MHTIRMEILRDGRFRSTDGFHVYGDNGTGTVDWGRPLTPRRVLFWDEAASMAPHLEGGHVAGHHLDSVPREPAPDQRRIVWTMGPHVFGLFRHVVVIEDEIGNHDRENALEYVTLINSYPPPASRFRVASFDRMSSRLTFEFEPSERLVG